MGIVPHEYKENLTGKHAAVVQHGNKILHDIPLLKKLADAGIISAVNDFNCIYAYRKSKDEQKSMMKDGLPTFPSRAFKFAVKADPSKFGNCYHTWHGNVNGKGLKSICENGLRGYSKTDPNRPRCMRKDCTLVTPSWVVALNCYGYGFCTPDGKTYRVAIQVLVDKNADINKCHDTFFHNQDWFVPHDEIEWSVPIISTSVVGIVVKQFESEEGKARLAKCDNHGWRKAKMRC